MPENYHHLKETRVPMETDPKLVNDHDRQVEAALLKQGEGYAERNAVSKKQNADRAKSRAIIKELGLDPNAYATAIKHIKDMTPADRKLWMDSYKLTLKAMGDKQMVLFPEEAIKAEKRAQRKREKAQKEKAAAAEAKAKSIEAGDDNPRSDPKKGGAGGVKGRQRAKDVIEGISAADRAEATSDRLKRVAEASEAPPVDVAEQAEGEAIFDTALSGMKERAAEETGKPLSQSAQAAAKLAEAKLA